ncbi:TENA/THI-4 family protein [Fructobacillus pseudoficulneus]|uniref:Aminopyrimidine aminohydrolase n=1 Tax=Fructobacillus pseudoficulneus TaxID=220714 RepID=A0A3F3GVM6_9LACO|nr:hypothetical protein [Fructobacillus pseudoficulneus]GAP03401.1 TENA/THI-4 family protein [Fructobacillus pseudoficulneus]SEH46261.1 thiaminase (transcriptional activator TenA) [Fructobacillus pseudoficulneus]
MTQERQGLLAMVERAKPIWQESYQSNFIQEIQAGSLDQGRLVNYLIQDQLFLAAYARFAGQAMALAPTMEDLRFYYSTLSYLADTGNDSADSWQQQFLREQGVNLDDYDQENLKPATKELIAAMQSIVAGGRAEEMMVSLFPCLVSYSYIFQLVADHADLSAENIYADFFKDYATKEYQLACQRWLTYGQQYLEKRQAVDDYKLENIFLRVSRLETLFWQSF